MNHKRGKAYHFPNVSTHKFNVIKNNIQEFQSLACIPPPRACQSDGRALQSPPTIRTIEQVLLCKIRRVTDIPRRHHRARFHPHGTMMLSKWCWIPRWRHSAPIWHG
ncbi:hypothetical protein A11S_726 [Micavibrio aeruginosavorus EPB]|uniref:Uncharacterized protein n=1 Tax=Micavibrio aeruginosavorus EPB TaxID=349215 RepID=M4VGF6_9BACT|nr:hypothetical protein A11S_726 [Micavibrio aeruginosavorus EPB]